MKLIKTEFHRGSLRRLSTFFLLYCVCVSVVGVRGQSAAPMAPAASSPPEAKSDTTQKAGADFRIEKVTVPGGSELLTIFARQGLVNGSAQGPVQDLPLVSVLRDTLGDDKPENDRLRYVWMLTHTKASFTQKLSAFVPFLYGRTTNTKIGTEAPPAVIDVQPPSHAVWNKVFWFLFKRLVLDEVRLGVRLPSLQYRQNAADYRRSAVTNALTVLSLYQEVEGEKLLTDIELQDIQARLSLTDKMLGWHMQRENFSRVNRKEQAKTQDFRGHNWELLRQYAEEQGLYFDPLEMSDGLARHAVVWTTAADVAANKGKAFERRFLNIDNPWTDAKLVNWQGFSQVRWFDEDDREVDPETPGAKPKTMIPLAIYGLDNPKIPVILVDFRDNGNPKKREMSQRILNDITGSVLSLSRFSGFPYFFSRLVYEFVTGRRGADLNQASRFRSYSQLKLLLSLEASLDPDFRNEIEQRLESATLNPLQNDAEVEANLARRQYSNLLAYAKRPDGLAKKIRDDRREEMVRLKHGRKGRFLFGIARVFSFGLYVHREQETPELLAQMDVRRQLDFHERFVREVAFASAKPEIDTNVTELKRSLAFIAENGMAAQGKTTRALAKIFSITADDDARALCLSGLYRINNSPAKKELLAIHGNNQVEERWRSLCARYLKSALEEGQRISTRDAHAISVIGTN